MVFLAALTIQPIHSIPKYKQIQEEFTVEAIENNPNNDIEEIQENTAVIKQLPKLDEMDRFMELLHDAKGLMSRYRCAIMEVETKFKVLNEELSLQSDHNPIESIKSRLKAPESIFGKLKRKHLPVTLESIEGNLFDIAGVRVICCFIDDIYMLADCLIRQDDVTLIEMKDYIRNPKGNGYRSLHLIISVPIFLQNEKRNVKVEVQLRTIAMEFWATWSIRCVIKRSFLRSFWKRSPRSLVRVQRPVQSLICGCRRSGIPLSFPMKIMSRRIKIIN